MAFIGKRRGNLQIARRSSSVVAQGRLISLFLKLFVICFSFVVISNIFLLNKKDSISIDLEAISQKSQQEAIQNTSLETSAVVNYDASNSTTGPNIAVQLATQLTQNTTTTKNDYNSNSIHNSVAISLQNKSSQQHEDQPEVDRDEDKDGSAYLTMYGEHRVKAAIASLPKWLQDYFAWHRDQRTPSNESEARYLVIACVGTDKCGGFSDRLRTLPYYLFLASRLDRVLCIYWTRPFGLDWFLQPLPSGIDWRCPADLEPLVNKEKPSRYQTYKHYTVHPFKKKLTGPQATEAAINAISESQDRFHSVTFLNQDFAKIDMSNMVTHAYSFEKTMPGLNAWMHSPLMEHIFRAMFEPIEPIAKSINATMTKLGLVENEYTSVHVRARYPTNGLMRIIGEKKNTNNHDIGHIRMNFEGRYKSYLTNIGTNAIACGVLLKPDNTIFFSSDSVNLTRHFLINPVKLGEKQREYQPLGIDSREEIRHLEHSHKKDIKLDRIEYYPLIEDVLIMGGSQCVSHGVGSFGSFGAGLAGDRCRAIHRSPSNGRPVPCPNSRGNNIIANITDKDLIFGEKESELGEGRLPPAKPQNMQELDFHSLERALETNVEKKVLVGQGNQNALSVEIADDGDQEHREGSPFLTMYGEHRAQQSLQELPKWLSDYFAWHRNQTSNSSNETKYLVIACLERDKCGGFSDRLRPLPFWLLTANKTNRVLCIYWARPFGLDWFLKPLPRSGIDWRCPKDFIDVLDPNLPSRYQPGYQHHILFAKKHKHFTAVEIAKKCIDSISQNLDRFTSVGFKAQDFAKIDKMNMIFHAYSYNATVPVVNAWMHVPLTEHIFRVMFEPIETIARSINATMTRLGLVENEYTSVHVRARYPTREMMTILGGSKETNDHDKNDKKLAFEGTYKKMQVDLALNSLECGMLLKPGNTIFFSSDSVDLTNYVMNAALSLPTQTESVDKQKLYHIVGIDSREEIKHLEHGRHVSHVEFYPLIEDLLIMGGSECVSHGIGSFGAFAAGLSGDRCRAIHRNPAGILQKCPNSRGVNKIFDITDELVMGDTMSDLGEGRLTPPEGKKISKI
eukprot:scaffold844_cov268-Chaetoceros_neogracile.AAC.44